MLDPLERRDELERDVALLVPLDVLQQELVLGDVHVREVKLDLLDDLLAGRIGGRLDGFSVTDARLRLAVLGDHADAAHGGHCRGLAALCGKVRDARILRTLKRPFK